MLGLTIVGGVSFASMGLLLALTRPRQRSPRHRQPHLSAHVLPQRPLDADPLHAPLAPALRTRPPHLSSLSTRAQHLRLSGLHGRAPPTGTPSPASPCSCSASAGSSSTARSRTHSRDNAQQQYTLTDKASMHDAIQISKAAQINQQRQLATSGSSTPSSSSSTPSCATAAAYWFQSLAIYVSLPRHLHRTYVQSPQQPASAACCRRLLPARHHLFPFNSGASCFFIYAAAFLPFIVASASALSLVIFAAQCHRARRRRTICFTPQSPSAIVRTIGLSRCSVIGGSNIFFAHRSAPTASSAPPRKKTSSSPPSPSANASPAIYTTSSATLSPSSSSKPSSPAASSTATRNAPPRRSPT